MTASGVLRAGFGGGIGRKRSYARAENATLRAGRVRGLGGVG